MNSRHSKTCKGFIFGEIFLKFTECTIFLIERFHARINLSLNEKANLHCDALLLPQTRSWKKFVCSYPNWELLSNSY